MDGNVISFAVDQIPFWPDEKSLNHQQHNDFLLRGNMTVYQISIHASFQNLTVLETFH